MGNFDFLKDYEEYELYDVAVEAENLYKYEKFRASLNACRVFLEACCKNACRKFNEEPEYRHEGVNRMPILDISRSFQKIAFSDNTRIDIEHISNNIRVNANEGSHYNCFTQNQLIEKAYKALKNVQDLAKWYVLRVYSHNNTEQKLPQFTSIKTINIEQKFYNDAKTIENQKTIIENLKNYTAEIQELYSILEKDCEDTQEQLYKAKNQIKNSKIQTEENNNNFFVSKEEYEKQQELTKQYRDKKILLEGKIHYLEKDYQKVKKIQNDYEQIKIIKDNLEKINHNLAERIGELTTKNQELENIIKTKSLKIKEEIQDISKNTNNELKLTNEVEIDVYKTIEIMESVGIIYITDKTIPNFLAGVTTSQTTVFQLNTYKDLFGKYKNEKGMKENTLKAIASLLKKELILKRSSYYALNKNIKI